MQGKIRNILASVAKLSVPGWPPPRPVWTARTFPAGGGGYHVGGLQVAHLSIALGGAGLDVTAMI